MARALSNPVRLSSPEKGVDGRTTLAGARAPTITDGRIGDFWVDTDAKKLYGPKNAAGWPDNGLIKGDKGWAPVFGVVSDGQRRVQRVVDWQGGEGTKPATGQYVGATGLVSDIADAVDIRGPEGPEMIIDNLDAAAEDIADDTQMPVAEAESDNEKRTVIEVFDLGGRLDRLSVAHAEASTVRKNIKRLRVQFHDPDYTDGSTLRGGASYRRVNAEPDHDAKLRTLDRWTAEGESDSENGGWWELDERVVNPLMFGNNAEPGVTDMTEAVRAMHEYANKYRLGWSYEGISEIAIDADAQIIINTPGHGHGVFVRTLNGIVGTPSSDTANVMFRLYDENTPVVTGTHDISGDASSTKLANSKTLTKSIFDGPGFVYMQGADGTGPVIAGRNPGHSTLNYRQSFAIDRDGEAVHGLSRDITGFTSIWCRIRANSEHGWLTFGGFRFDQSEVNNQCFIQVERNETHVHDIAFDASENDLTDNTIDRMIRVLDAAYVSIDNIRASARPNSNNGSYVLNVQNAAMLWTSRITGINGWGVFGTNNVNGWWVERCNINRVDGHNGIHNVFVSNCTLHDNGVRYGWGGGTMKVSDCHIIDGPVVASRQDYGGYWYGDITVDNCTGVIDSYVWKVVDMSSNPIGPDTIEAPCPNIYVRNVVRNGLDDNTGSNAEIRPVDIAVRSDAMGLYAPAEIVVDGIHGSDGWRFSMSLDYANMKANPTAISSTHHLRVSRVYPTTNIRSATQGIYVPPNTLVGMGVTVHMKLVDIHRCALTADNLGTSLILEADHVEWIRAIWADSVRADLTDCRFRPPALFGSETIAVLGGGRGTNSAHIAINGGHSRGPWDFAYARSIIGLTVSEGAGNTNVVLPSGCSRYDAFRGWQNTSTYPNQSAPFPSYTVAQLGTGGMVASSHSGRFVWASNANGGAGALCRSNGTDWIDLGTGSAVAT